MITTSLRALAVFAGIGLFGCTADTRARAAQPVDGSIAVVELFTSEGCSSCPPADAVLGRLVHATDQDGRAIYPIAWHVDYWDRLGWRDLFSSADATARQNAYAAAFHLDSIYTPQMIVNGKTEFVGSDEGRATKEIAAALATHAASTITLTTQSAGDHSIKVAFTVDHAIANAVINIVAVESGLTTHVARGENGGRTLTHEHVARAFKQLSIASATKGNATLDLPADVDLEKVAVISFVQDETSMQILGATQARP